MIEKAKEELTKIYSFLRISDHLERDGEKKRKIHIKFNPGILIYFKGLIFYFFHSFIRDERGHIFKF